VQVGLQLGKDGRQAGDGRPEVVCEQHDPATEQREVPAVEAAFVDGSFDRVTPHLVGFHPHILLRPARASQPAQALVPPGPDAALVLRSAVQARRRQALFTGVGVAAGLMVWGLLTALGVAALLSASPLLYRVLCAGGAAWLVLLGVRAFRAARRPADGHDLADRGRAGRSPAGLWRAFGLGLSTNLLNPKALVFYVSLLPQFVPADSNAFAVTLLPAAIHAGLNVLWFTGIAWAANRAAAVFRRPRVRAWLDRVTGVVLLGFGAKLITSLR
jgi:threonine/homoserine/homoserine lactone efflux protein